MHPLHLVIPEIAGHSPAIRSIPKDSPAQNPDGSTSASDSRLTVRRKQVLVLYLSGEPRKAIARRLGVSPHTVRNHIRAIYEELEVSNRIEALRWALQQPMLADQLLRPTGTADEVGRSTGNPSSTPEPVRIADLVAEAINFFQLEVILSPMDLN